MTPLKTQAIQTALMGDWNEAISLNHKLLEEDPSDTEALNRLAFALTAIGKIKDAKHTYQRVLNLDPNNPIASKNLKRLAEMNKPLASEKKMSDSTVIQLNNIFLEETGKTKVIELMNMADKKVISRLRTGEFLTLSIKRLKVFVLDYQKQYIGMIPDNIGRRLIKFINGGNSYGAYVKAVKNNSVTIFVKEIKRAKRFENQPSFLMIEKSHLEMTESKAKGKKMSKASQDVDKKDDYEEGDEVEEMEEES